MSDSEPGAPPADEEATVTVHPGDVVQITDIKHAGVGCFLSVEACYSWGIGATMRFLDRTRVLESYHRLKPGQFTVCGAAAVVSPDVLAARRASLGTAALVASERGS